MVEGLLTRVVEGLLTWPALAAAKWPRRLVGPSLRLVVPCCAAGPVGEGVSVLNEFRMLSLLLLFDLGFLDSDDLPFFSRPSNLFNTLFLL